MGGAKLEDYLDEDYILTLDPNRLMVERMGELSHLAAESSAFGTMKIPT